MREQLKLPIGIESFSKIRTSGFYYVDKTRLIEQLLKNPSEVNLFTRPRRFGKSLNMSMLQNFFEIGCNKMLFDGLDIFQNTALCDAYMGQFPVISITLKGVDGQTYADAIAAMKDIIGIEAARFPFLAESTNLTDTEKDLYRGYVQVENGIFSMPNEALPAALRNISLLLAKHFQKEVIILIDEYDVPLDKAFQHGYYNEMISLIRTMLGNALKTNNSLKFAVLTGCLRITKESVFTGLNNFKIYSITSTGYLTTKSGIRENPYQLMIPNQEIRGLFIDQIRIWFKETSRANKETISTFCSAFPERNAAVIKHLHRLKTSNMPPAWKKTA